MTTNDRTSGLAPRGYNKRFDAVRVQLSSSSPSDIFRAIGQINKWLEENPENQEIYSLLLDGVQENPELKERVYAIIERFVEKGSKAATEAIEAFPERIQIQMADADNAYYSADYDKAIQLYGKVLQMEPSNQRAHNQLAKAYVNKFEWIGTSPHKDLPLTAIQWFRRARSYITANDIKSAVTLLNAAIEEASAKGVKFLEAEKLLIAMQDLLDTSESTKIVPFAKISIVMDQNIHDVYLK